MRNTMTAVVFCLLAVLLGAGLLAATEPQDDEKITMPAPVTPDKSGSVTIVPPPPSSGGTTILTPPPAQAPPIQGGTVILPPSSETSPPVQAAPVEIPVIPVSPDKTAPVEVPVIPVSPDKTAPAEIPIIPVVPNKTTPVEIPVITQPLVTPPLQQETTPPKEAIAPQPTPLKPEPPAGSITDKQASPVDFLPMPTPLTTDKMPSEPRAEKDKQPGQARPEEPKTKAPQSASTKPKAGAPLRIPPNAAKTGDLSFLEGCWRGTRPEYATKRIITERFCFGKNGSGKRTIEDPQYAGRCTGATKGSFGAQGKLTVTSEKGYCTGGAQWAPAYMICQGEGNSTPCYWQFPLAGGGSQSYKIQFIRE